MAQRFLLLGAHLHEADIEGVEGATGFDGGLVTLSAMPYDSDRGIASRDTIERAAAVRQALTRRETFVAIRYGATAANESEAREKCSPHAARWRALLERYRGHVEVTLRLGAPAGALRPNRKDFATGRDYLEALRRMRSVAPDPAFVAAVDEAFRPLVLRAKWRTRDDATSELVALLPRNALDRARAAGESLQASFPHIPFLLSGPWPLEVFADEE